MRTKPNLYGSNRRVAEKVSLSSLPHMPPNIPMEWLDAGSWRLPSGKALAEFALQAGFLAPLLFKAGRISKPPQCDTETRRPLAPAMTTNAKHVGKGSER